MLKNFYQCSITHKIAPELGKTYNLQILVNLQAASCSIELMICKQIVSKKKTHTVEMSYFSLIYHIFQDIKTYILTEADDQIYLVWCYFVMNTLMMICGWTTLTSQHLLKNDHKRQGICQIRHENCLVVRPVFQVCLFYASQSCDRV